MEFGRNGADEVMKGSRSTEDRLDVGSALQRQNTDSEESLQPYVVSGFQGFLESPYVAGAAVLSTVGGLLFGRDFYFFTSLFPLPATLSPLPSSLTRLEGSSTY
ncbi:monosaccharide transporter protein [Rutstroemia sp. NJR-2017a WRK4]|nr:monosaccharide transporter protein [Rutstroemia sp. NJR-2017a WRK4]